MTTLVSDPAPSAPLDNPMGTDGFEFVEFAHPEPRRLAALFQTMGLSDMAYWARVHLDIIARFGRFPHRNPVLGRVSTPAELDFLKAGGFAG